ncbi:peptidylprolyl isomerase [Yoonia sp. MH D7]
MRKLPLIGAFVAFGLTLGTGLAAQDIRPVITVNDSVITAFELDQRQRMLGVFRTPGDLGKAARDGLIEDRLKQQELNRSGLRLSDESLQAAMNDFAERANLTLDQFITVLGNSGIEQETLRDFVEIGITWRDYVRGRFNTKSNVSEAEVTRAIAQAGSGGSEIEVLLTEIIIPAPPPQAAQAQATAERISQLTSTAAFEAQARQVSALPSRADGGRLGWLPLSNYPQQLHGLILSLSPGDVTAPIPIPNGIALFQLRALREVAAAKIAPTSIDYATYYIAGGRSEAGLRAAATLKNNIDTCDDLYGQARGQSPDVLDRQDRSPAEIPQDVALELARLDAGESSFNLTSADGQTLMFIMMCGRTNAAADGADRDAVRSQLRSQRLASHAEALLEDLRSSATITTR